MNENKFGKILLELRTDRGISQRTVGEALGVVNQTISFWENGSREPDMDTLLKIAKYFDVSIDYLFGNEF